MTRTVFTVHGIGSPVLGLCDYDPAMWLGEDDFLYVVDSLDDGKELTFDDGLRSCWSIALPVLCKRRIAARFFISVAHLNTPGFITTSELLEIQAAGMTIGTHGMYHKPWRGLSAAEYQLEIVDSKHMLEDILGAPVTEAACPLGQYCREAISVLRQINMKRVYTSDRIPARLDDWLVPRYTIRASHIPTTFQRILDGKEPTFSITRRLKMIAKSWV